MPIVFFFHDTAPELKTMAPSGADVYPREIDLENVKKLKFQLTEVAESFGNRRKSIERKRS